MKTVFFSAVLMAVTASSSGVASAAQSILSCEGDGVKVQVNSNDRPDLFEIQVAEKGRAERDYITKTRDSASFDYEYFSHDESGLTLSVDADKGIAELQLGRGPAKVRIEVTCN
ncbi:MAG: hypothetical protein ACXWPM_05970 [Bdellovibrionota bacterium]